jgi:hypothetical protein
MTNRKQREIDRVLTQLEQGLITQEQANRKIARIDPNRRPPQPAKKRTP